MADNILPWKTFDQIANSNYSFRNPFARDLVQQLPSGALGPGNGKVKEWEVQQEQRCQNLANQELTEKKQRRENAQKELQTWYSDRKDKMKTKLAANRTQEAAWQRLQADAGADKNPWERVLSLISELPSKQDQPPVNDTSRFKQMLLKLKAEPVTN